MTLNEETYSALLGAEDAPLINIGYGSDVTIKELAEMICRVLEYEGELVFDTSKPDGTPRKLMDSSRIRALGWAPKVNLETGIQLAFESARDILDRSVSGLG